MILVLTFGYSAFQLSSVNLHFILELQAVLTILLVSPSLILGFAYIFFAPKVNSTNYFCFAYSIRTDFLAGTAIAVLMYTDSKYILAVFSHNSKPCYDSAQMSLRGSHVH